MTWSRRGQWTMVASVLVAIGTVVGCALQEDLFNPIFVSNLGGDVAVGRVDPQPSVVTIIFRNNVLFVDTDAVVSAGFNLVYLDGTGTNATKRQTTYVVAPASNFLLNIALTCPIGVIALGEDLTLTNGVYDATDPAAVLTSVALDGSETETDVSSEALPLRFNQDFTCGQVIEYELVPSGDEQRVVTRIFNALPPGTAMVQGPAAPTPTPLPTATPLPTPTPVVP